jgi:glycosyltransferase involved in cell wall biosynthesis
MVKNEEDIVADSVLNLLEQGVDHVLVADNGSTDATAEILGTLAARHPVHVVSDPIVPYWQAEKISLLARAAVRGGAAWIVPFDADEIWRADEGTVAETLRATTAPVVTATWWDYVPIAAGDGQSAVERFPHRLREPAELRKVAFRANWLVRVNIGSHSVALPHASQVPGLRVAHYRFRSVDQMLRKARDGAAALRSSGLPASVPYWLELADADEADAQRFLEALVSRPDVVFDPVADW